MSTVVSLFDRTGTCNAPQKAPLPPLDEGLGEQTAISWVSPGPERANIRAATPKGFALAFFIANHGMQEVEDGDDGEQLSLFDLLEG